MYPVTLPLPGVFPHITSVKPKVKARLLTELPVWLAAADAAAADGITTPPPYEVHTCDKADLGGLPSLELLVTGSSRTADSFAQVYRHRLLLGVTVGGDREEVITAQIERYVWCLRQIVLSWAMTPIEGTADAETGNEQYSPLAQRPETVERPFVKGAFLEVFVTTVD